MQSRVRGVGLERRACGGFFVQHMVRSRALRPAYRSSSLTSVSSNSTGTCRDDGFPFAGMIQFRPSFSRSGKLRRLLAPEGGPPRTICNGPDHRCATISGSLGSVSEGLARPRARRPRPPCFGPHAMALATAQRGGGGRGPLSDRARPRARRPRPVRVGPSGESSGCETSGG